MWPARLAMPIGGLLLTLQGIPELFRAFHKMGKERERYFVMALQLCDRLGVVGHGRICARYDTRWRMVYGSMKARPGLSKPTIGLIMLGAMIFVIFIGFPISFTLIFLAFIFGFGVKLKLTTLLMTLNTNSTMLNDQLMAVPLFILMGIEMEAAGLM